MKRVGCQNFENFVTVIKTFKISFQYKEQIH